MELSNLQLKSLFVKTIRISDQFFGKTLANMKANPRVAAMFWDGFEGYQVKGTVTIEITGPRFEETARWIEELTNNAGFPLKSKGGGYYENQ